MQATITTLRAQFCDFAKLRSSEEEERFAHPRLLCGIVAAGAEAPEVLVPWQQAVLMYVRIFAIQLQLHSKSAS